MPRITQIEDDYDDIDIEDLIPNENMVVTMLIVDTLKSAK